MLWGALDSIVAVQTTICRCVFSFYFSIAIKISCFMHASFSRYIDVEQFAAVLNTNTRLPGSSAVQQLSTASGRGKYDGA